MRGGIIRHGTMQSACLIEQSLEVASPSGCGTGGRITRIDRSGINRDRKKELGDKERKIGPSVEGVTAIYLIGLIRRGRMVVPVRPFKSTRPDIKPELVP